MVIVIENSSIIISAVICMPFELLVIMERRRLLKAFFLLKVYFLIENFTFFH
jgi:hypothetical protein